MTQPVSVVDRFVAGLRNNRLTGALIIVGIVVIALASFTEALTKIVALLPEFRETNIAGRWQSDVLTDAGTKFKYTYSFDLKTDGARLYGSVTREHLPAISQRRGRVVASAIPLRSTRARLSGTESPSSWTSAKFPDRPPGLSLGPRKRFVV